jgi:uncharacterized membrane protein YphA (DoxX/SURF4 family)
MAKRSVQISSDVILRLGLAFVFIYAAISGFQHPEAWVGFVPHFVTNFISAKTFLDVFGVFQLILALALVTGKYIRYTAALSFLAITGLLVFNLNSLIVTFRDVGLACMALALFVGNPTNHHSRPK